MDRRSFVSILAGEATSSVLQRANAHWLAALCWLEPAAARPRVVLIGGLPGSGKSTLARALANRPKLVLADEPTGALDTNNAQQVLELIRKLCDEVKASLLLVSHDPTVTSQFPRVVTLAELNRT